MAISEGMKKTLGGVFAVVLLAVGAAWMLLNPGPEHIEDRNGPDNYSLQQITKEDVVALKMGSRGGPSESETQWNFGPLSVSSGIKYSSRKFTGVYRLYSCTIFKGSDIYVQLADFQVKSGNFAFYVVFDGRVVGEVKPDEFGTAQFTMENVNKTGTLDYIIAGESANFSFVSPGEW